MYSIRIRAFRAIEEIHLCEKFMKGHREVLEIFGITEITSANTEWFHNPNAYVIIAESIESGKIVGGARIHVVGGTQPLPIEDAVGKMDPHIYKLVEEHGNKGSGELCGLWNAREVAGMGISTMLTRAAIALAMHVNLSTLFIICAERTYQNIFKDQGFEIIPSLGDHGSFYYPKSDMVAVALIINDLHTLSKATNTDRMKIMDIKNNPKQQKTEMGAKDELDVHYNLLENI